MWGSEKQTSYQTLQFSKVRGYVNLGPRLHELGCKLVASTGQLPAQHHRARHHKRAFTKINHKPCPCQGPYSGQRILPQHAPMHPTPVHGAIIQEATCVWHTCKNSIHNVLKVPLVRSIRPSASYNIGTDLCGWRYPASSEPQAQRAHCKTHFLSLKRSIHLRCRSCRHQSNEGCPEGCTSFGD